MQSKNRSALFLFFFISAASYSYPQQSYPFPEGCGNPFARQDEFDQFFEAALVSLAIDKGPNGRAVDDLYATNELRKEFKELDPSYGLENPISEHIKAQLCVFEKVKMQQNPGTKSIAQLEIDSKNEELHKHLQAVGAKLYRDSRKVFLETKKLIEKKRKEEAYFQSREAIIKSAASRGRAKIKDIL